MSNQTFLFGTHYSYLGPRKLSLIMDIWLKHSRQEERREDKDFWIPDSSAWVFFTLTCGRNIEPALRRKGNVRPALKRVYWTFTL